MNAFIDWLSAPSVVDWCEPNHVWSPWIAEGWNTLSSLVIAAGGAAGWWWWARPRPEARFTVAFGAVVLIGLGSAAFHGLLNRGAQALDELPMVYLGLIGAWILLHRDRPLGYGREVGAAMGSFAALFTLGYALLPGYFELFLGVYALTVAYVVLRSAWLALDARAPSGPAALCLFGGGCYVGGFALLWLPEHVLLDCDHPLQALQLHAWFHVTSMLGTVAWFRWCILDRDAARAAAS